MPLQKAEPFERFPAISLKAWKVKQARTFYFMDDDKDVKTPNGVMFLMHVKENNETKELWVKDQTALAIGLAPFVPLKGRTLKVVKSGSGLKDTRYTAEELKVKG